MNLAGSTAHMHAHGERCSVDVGLFAGAGAAAGKGAYHSISSRTLRNCKMISW